MYATELQLDALKEVINLGVGYAAGSLNELVGRPISLQVPEVDLMPLGEARSSVAAFSWGRVAAVQLAFSGALTGTVALVLPYDGAVELVSILTEDEGSNADVDGIRAATLEETGNIILNGVVGAVSNLLNDQISFSIPYYSEQVGLPVRLVGVTTSPDMQVIIARARFAVSGHQIKGEIVLFLEMSALQGLLVALDRFMESPVQP